MEAARLSNDRRRLKGEASRQAIIEAAIACIANRGLSNFTLDQVADRINVSRALVIFHFKSKNGLLTNVLNFLDAKYFGGWEAALAEEEDGPTVKKLLALLDFEARFALEQREYLSVWHAFWGEAKGNSLYRELSMPRDEQNAREFRDLLDTLVLEGGYEEADVAAVETNINAILWGLSVLFHLHDDPDIYDKGMRGLHCYLRSVFPRHHWDDRPGPGVIRDRQEVTVS